MKKLIVATMVGSVLFSGSALAETKGHYLGFNVIRTSLEAGDYTSSVSGQLDNGSAYNINDEDQFSVGVSYKYAFNFGGVYLAPGVFYDHSNVSTNDKFSQTWDLNARYGVRVDLGYDFTDSFAAYGHVGSVSTNHGLENGSGFKDTATDTSVGYGVGVKFALSDSVDFNVEYEVSEYDAELVFSDGEQVTQDFETQVARVGVAYHF